MEKFYNLLREGVEWGVSLRLKVRLKKSTSKEPVLILAHDLGDPKKVVTGGLVKLLSLSRGFAVSPFEGNILYLVTSGLPPGALAWARRAREKGIKVVINQNGVAFPAWADAQTQERLNLRNKKLLELADFVIFQSQFCKVACEVLVLKGAPLKARWSIIHNPIDTDKFDPADKPLGSEVLRLLVMGSHRHMERLILPIEVIKLLKQRNMNAELTIAGGIAPSLAPAVSQMANEVGHVKITGPYLQADAPSIYKAHHVLIHLQDKDASPTVPLEAMACGLQVVSVNSGGLPELVSPEGGELLNVDQGWNQFFYPRPEDLVEAVLQCFARYSANHKAVAEKTRVQFSARSWVASHGAIFKELLGGA